MTNYFIQNAIVGTEASKPDPANPTGNAQAPNYPLFIAGDTGKIYQSTGSAWVHVDTVGLAGVTTDSQGNMTVKSLAVESVPDPTGLTLDLSTILAVDAGFFPVAPLEAQSYNYYFTWVTDGGLETLVGNPAPITLDGTTDVVIQPPTASPPAGAASFSVYRTSDTYPAAQRILTAQGFSDPAIDNTPDADLGGDGVLSPDFNQTRNASITGPLQVDGGLSAASEILSGPGGATSTHASHQRSGQTGYLYQGIGSDGGTKFSVGVDGEVLTTDDLLAPLGIVKGKILEIVPQTAAGAPAAGAHNAGEFYADTSGGLFFCTVSGTPGTWKTVGLA